ncbi:MAG: amidohydrolase, partial [Rhizobium oryzihabitans]
MGLFFAHAANFMLAKEEIPNSIWRPTTRRGTKKGKKRMPILNRVAEMQEEVAGWRRHLHEHPELLY